MKQIFFTIILLISTYICIAIAFWPEIARAYVGHSEFYEAFYYLCPWLLLFMSIKCWHQSFVWRRMITMRNPAPSLSRGETLNKRKTSRASILERLSMLLIILSLIALWRVLR